MRRHQRSMIQEILFIYKAPENPQDDFLVCSRARGTKHETALSPPRLRAEVRGLGQRTDRQNVTGIQHRPWTTVSAILDGLQTWALPSSEPPRRLWAEVLCPKARPPPGLWTTSPPTFSETLLLLSESAGSSQFSGLY